ncbi:hypothetical protein A3C26_01040 [Candidatus Daviesbacteria bacterium RIFCSPHIGHO2_02_FULL_39_12]|nr:MAG: hypothetical protein A3C26_01040 [Candidatus Daviesbacteria bacterium RIFCSPHIGHO2_02_FULL_39_12]
MSTKINKSFLIAAILYLTNIAIQNYNLGKIVDVFTDEGVYLYSAKLLIQGLIPFKDFFLAQPPFLLYIVGAIQLITGYNMELFRFLYTLWVFSAIFPIFFIVRYFTKDNLAATLSILFFSTFSELVQWDMHSFAYRQASLPFLAFSILLIVIKRSKILAGLLLGLFAISLISNIFIALSLIISLLLSQYLIEKKKISQIITEFSPFVLAFSLISTLTYLGMLLIPHGYDNLIGYQLQRPFLPFAIRIEWVKLYTLNYNWPILIFGLLGSLFINKKIGLFGLFNIFSLLTIIFLGRSYYPHYLTILAVGLSVSCGILISYLNKIIITKVISASFIILIIYQTSYAYLKTQLIDERVPGFFSMVTRLTRTPQPLFTFEPIYGLYAKKDLTFHYNVADMRYFRVTGKNLKEKDYFRIIQNSNSILIEPFASSYLNQEVLNYIKINFKKIYDDGTNSIYAKI